MKKRSKRVRLFVILKKPKSRTVKVESGLSKKNAYLQVSRKLRGKGDFRGFVYDSGTGVVKVV